MRPLLLLLLLSWGGASERVGVFAAASLREAMQEVADGYRPATVVLTCGSSATLAKQLLAGAPGDLFVSADDAWMDALAAGDGIAPDSRRPLLGNRLVLITPVDRPRALVLDGPLPAFPGRLALADPTRVPSGRGWRTGSAGDWCSRPRARWWRRR